MLRNNQKTTGIARNGMELSQRMKIFHQFLYIIKSLVTKNTAIK